MHIVKRLAPLALLMICGIAVGASNDRSSDDAAAKKAKVAAEAKEKLVEMGILNAKAKDVATGVKTLVKDGKVGTDGDSVELMKALLQQMDDMKEQISKLQEDVTGLLGWVEGQNENLPIMQNDIATIKKSTPTTYIQFQYSDNQTNGNADGFAMRRFRIGRKLTIDPRTKVKLSFDVATGGQRLAAELKDAILEYDIQPSDVTVGTELLFGQQPLPIGYEIERSSSDREFPERSLYNRTMFNGERDRGGQIKYGISDKAFIHAGIWNSMTIQDPQQVAANSFANVGGILAGTAGIRVYDVHYDFGLAGFFGERPAFTGGPAGNQKTTDKVNRQIIYADGSYVGVLFPQLTLRGEVMLGKDRVPTNASDGTPRFLHETNVLGWHGNAIWNVNYRNQVALKFEYFDPDRNSRNDGTKGFGIAWIHYLNPGVKLTAAYEIFDEEGTESRNNVTTIRMQFKL